MKANLSAISATADFNKLFESGHRCFCYRCEMRDLKLLEAAGIDKSISIGWDLSRDVLARIELEIRVVTDRELAVLAAALDIKIEEVLTFPIAKKCLKELRVSQ